MNNIVLPQQFNTPPNDKSVSILISSFNTPEIHIKDCLNSIKSQKRFFNIELVWINDGSDKLHTTLLKNLLNNFINTTRFTSLIYNENETNKGIGYSLNKGIGYSLNKGIKLYNNEIIIKMDSNDIMSDIRIQKQIEYMELNPNIMICGCQIYAFRDNINNIEFMSNHSTITWENYKQSPSQWFVNHSTLCYHKKSNFRNR
jgi:GT2 family glycosyltransferase